MDEPLSNLDTKLRNQMRAEIIKLRQKINTTFIYVTHDQTEAMTLGDRIVIMKDGGKYSVSAQDITLGVRPSHMILADTPENTLSATVEVSELMGSEVHFHANVLSRNVVVIVPTMDVNGTHIKSFSTGDTLNLTFNGSVCHVFDKEGRNLEL